MSGLASNALLTVEEYLLLAGKGADNENIEEQRLELFINAVSQHIADYCGRTFVPSASVTEIRDGDGTTSLIVKNMPLLTLTSIEVWNGTGWTTLTAALYPRNSDSSTREIWFTEGHTFTTGKKNYKITYTYGYATADVPPDLKRVAMQLIQRALSKADGKEGITSQSFGDHSTSYDLATMPDDIREALNRYRRISYG